jgi:amino-acid N-acetyltransferase
MLPAGITVGTASDRAEVKTLLAACKLPTEDIGRDALFMVARRREQLCGVAGVEPFGAAGLLRSVAVHPAWRRKGIAFALCDAVMHDARQRGMRRLFLLTTDADRFFAKLGFTVTERAAVPAELRATAQFRELCPQSAIAMTRDL